MLCRNKLKTYSVVEVTDEKVFLGLFDGLCILLLVNMPGCCLLRVVQCCELMGKNMNVSFVFWPAAQKK